MNKSKRKIDSDKVLEVSFLGDKVGYYYWDGRTVTLRMYIYNKSQEFILKDILNVDNFFNPKTIFYL